MTESTATVTLWARVNYWRVVNLAKIGQSLKFAKFSVTPERDSQTAQNSLCSIITCVLAQQATLVEICKRELDGLRAISSNTFNNFLAQDNSTCSGSKSMKSALL